MNIDKELMDLAERILPPSSSDDIQTFAYRFEYVNCRDDWTIGIMSENDVDHYYSGYLYGSSAGPDIGTIIGRDIGIDEDTEDEIWPEDISALEDYIVEIAEKKFSDYLCYIVMDDNCLFLIAIPKGE